MSTHKAVGVPIRRQAWKTPGSEETWSNEADTTLPMGLAEGKRVLCASPFRTLRQA
jgi:hypothetical protein